MKRVDRIHRGAYARAGLDPSSARGMTIIELMVGIAVLGVLVSLLIAPAIGGMIARHRVQGVHSELLGDLQLARSEQAQRNGTSTSVSIVFSSNADLTCYTIHTGSTPCDCTRAPHQACAAVPDAEEIKTMQFERAVGVSVAASSPGGARITFAPPQGLATSDNMVIDVQSATRGQLRTSVSGLGVPTVCSPDGSIPGVRTC
jgi:prepilin-type N-terminal cleavage/methylation domain-containing protein